MGDNISSLDLRILEDRIAISVFALADIEVHELLLNGVIAIDSADHILDLNTIGPDILYC